MAERKVIRMGHPVLRQVARELTREEILGSQELIQDLFDTMKVEQGIGIAAPQIGESIQAAIIAIPADSERYPESEASQTYVIFNPKITILDETLQGFWEGCLSVPGLRGFVERPRQIRIDYLDQDANEQTIELKDFLATVFQHELDHLFGTLYVDRITDKTKIAYLEEFSKFHHPSREEDEI